MPPKVKFSWTQCPTCNCHYYTEFEQQHAAQCADINNLQVSTSYNGIYLLVKPVINNEGEDDLMPINRLHTIYMHPETMEMFGFGDFDFVEVDGKFVSQVIPKKISKSVVEMPTSIMRGHLKKDKLQKISIIQDAKTLKHVELETHQEMWIDKEMKKKFEFYIWRMLDDMHLRNGFHLSTSYLHWDVDLVVTSTSTDGDVPDPNEWLKFKDTTTLSIKVKGDLPDFDVMYSTDKVVTFEELGGCGDEREALTEMLMQSVGGDTSTSLLIHGRAGCGKSSLGNALGRVTTSVNFIPIGRHELRKFKNDENGKDLIKQLKKLIDPRKKNFFFFDDLDELCPKVELTAITDVEIARYTAKAINDLLDHPSVCFLLATCTKVNNIRPDLLSKFNGQFHIKTPGKRDRLEIFIKHCDWMEGSMTQEEIAAATDVCHGFVANNMVHMSMRAEFEVTSRDDGKVKVEDLMEAFEFVKSSIPDLHLHAMVTSPVYWDDIVGYSDLKLKVKQAFSLPLTNAEQFESLGLTKQRGILLYGPPGCCKTMVARAIATEFKLNFIAVRGSDLLSMYVGESEKNVAELFAKARMASPSLIFFDEIDSIATKRNSSDNGGTNGILSALLTEMDGLESTEGVALLAATNKPGSIDKALLRFKRLGQSIYVRLPCHDTRRNLLMKEFGKMCASKDIDVECIVKSTERFSGDELVKLCQQAGYKCLQEDIDGTIETKHFLEVLQTRLPSTSHHSLKEFEEFEKTHK